MSTHHRQRGTRLTAAVSILSMALCATSALAGAVQISAGSLTAGPIYTAEPGGMGTLHVDTTIWNGSILSMSPFLNGQIAPTNVPEPVPGRVEWTATLSEDLNPGGPLAHARFCSSGTFRLSGDLYSMGTLLNPDPEDKLLMEASWVSAFELTEAVDSPNKLVSGPTYGKQHVAVMISGGWLDENGYLEDWYGLTYNALGSKQDGSDVIDFQSDIISTSTTSMLILAAIPEPSTGLLALGMFGLLLGWRKRR